MDFTEKMRKYARSDTNSKHINACKEYIYSHIKERITIEDLADELGVSSGYLSRLFKKETGISVSAYIRSQKIDMAKNLLRFSDYSTIDIANRLSFSSQSHFIQQFREVVGMTPKKYPRRVLYGPVGTLNPALRVRKEIPPECRIKCLRCPKGYSVRRISFSSLSSPSGI